MFGITPTITNGGGLVERIYNELDIDNRLQVAFCSSHIKATLLETYCGKHIVIHGSGNYRSSNSIEQITITDDKDLFTFYDLIAQELIAKYKTINKAIVGKPVFRAAEEAIAKKDLLTI